MQALFLRYQLLCPTFFNVGDAAVGRFCVMCNRDVLLFVVSRPLCSTICVGCVAYPGSGLELSG